MDTSTILVRHFDEVFLREAELAVRRAKAARTRNNSMIHGSATFTAIVAAAAALEAYISEIAAHQVQFRLLTKWEQEEIRKKKEVPAKFRLLLRAWAVHRFHLKPLYLDLCALFGLRNSLIHRSAEFLVPGHWPRKLSPYKGRIPHVRGEGLDWTSQVLAAETGQWALQTAKAVLAFVRPEVPDPALLKIRDAPPGIRQ